MGGLCKQFNGDVYLTARDEARGKAAVASLEAEGLSPKFHICDLGDLATVEALRDTIKERHGGIDVLVNNAGIAFKQAATEPFGVQAEVTLATNYWANKAVCDLLFPILRPGARVVNMSSSAGFLGHIGRSGNAGAAAKLKATLASKDLTREALDTLMKNFVETAKSGTQSDQEAIFRCQSLHHNEDTVKANLSREVGWPNSTYVVSKIGWSALSRIHQREMDSDVRKDIVVNHVHPGYVDTELTSHKGPLTIDRGAESAIFASLLPPGTEVRGAYIWHDCQLVDWVNGPTPPMT